MFKELWVKVQMTHRIATFLTAKMLYLHSCPQHIASWWENMVCNKHLMNE